LLNVNNLPLISYEFSYETREYRSTLTIDETNYGHTGPYSCQFIKIEKFDEDVVKVSFNLFVNGEKMFTFNKVIIVKLLN
jgi:hypothetical protein